MEIKTSGDLRTFLADVLGGIKDGKVDINQANAISKVASQINQSLALEVSTALQLRRLEGQRLTDVSLSIAGDALPPPEVWCEQCDKRVTAESAKSCTSRFCKVR